MNIQRPDGAPPARADGPAPPPDERLLRQAVELARENMLSGRGGPFGALVVRDGEVIARSGNSVGAHNDPTAHAEVEAIRLACRALGHYRLDGCVIYSSCEPCPMCLAAAYWARVSAVYWAADRRDAAKAGFDDEYLYEQMGLEPGARELPMAAVTAVRPLAQGVFLEWLALEDKVLY